MVIGPKQTLGPITVTTAALTSMGFIKNTGGAETILIRARGGSQNYTVTLGALGCYDTNFVYGTDVTVNNGLTIEGSGFKTHGDAQSSAFAVIHASGRSIAQPCINLVAQAATGDIATVTFEVWVIYKDGSGWSSLPS